MLAGGWKQHGALVFEFLGDRRQFIDQRKALARDRKPVGGGEPLQPAAQIRMRALAGRIGVGTCCIHRLLRQQTLHVWPDGLAISDR